MTTASNTAHQVQAAHLRNGQLAEQEAARFLTSQGLQLITQNFRCRMGEIDLIMQEGVQLVFVEVRFRRNMRFGGAAASITAQKQLKLQRTAQFYLGRLNHQPSCRFDVVTLSPDQQGQPVCDNWIKNAF
jgi:putative endonuclease